MGFIGIDSGFVLSTGGVDSIGNTGSDTLPWWDYIYDSAWNIIDSTPALDTYFLSTSLMGNSDPDLLTIANSVPGLIVAGMFCMIFGWTDFFFAFILTFTEVQLLSLIHI